MSNANTSSKSSVTTRPESSASAIGVPVTIGVWPVWTILVGVGATEGEGETVTEDGPAEPVADDETGEAHPLRLSIAARTRVRDRRCMPFLRAGTVPRSQSSEGPRGSADSVDAWSDHRI